MRLSLALLFLSATATATVADPRLAGTYDGIIWSGFEGAGTTVLTVARDGTISGTYRYQDGSASGKGTLTDCTYSMAILRCTWNDAYGSGALVVRFDPPLKGFQGSWYDYSIPEPHDSPEGGYLWSGTRRPG
ncbi:MAG: hypothetical protein MUE52_12175 [Tabrizicola sp.]|jgi:hypothetical protein|nr:hypothetical protein [Tabrizicola sp.]